MGENWSLMNQHAFLPFELPCPACPGRASGSCPPLAVVQSRDECQLGTLHHQLLEDYIKCPAFLLRVCWRPKTWKRTEATKGKVSSRIATLPAYFQFYHLQSCSGQPQLGTHSLGAPHSIWIYCRVAL